ncbi:MAG: hypothetical protein Q7T71_11140 [Herbiconiux sp.]|nr:hypothetical protein [Herbiconiux sp.]
MSLDTTPTPDDRTPDDPTETPGDETETPAQEELDDALRSIRGIGENLNG